jgi:4'-phosphopantetheinyl transferase EntD
MSTQISRSPAQSPAAEPGALPFGLPPLFPASVVVAVADARTSRKRGLPEEEEAVRHATDARQREFRAGRACAREALSAFGLHHALLRVGATRAPLWPSGFVGSITHCEGVCAAAVARTDLLASLGMDMERRGRVDRNLRERLAAPTEIARWTQAFDGCEQDALTLLFSAKESVYKCLSPLLGRFLDFREVDLAPGERSDCFRMRSCTHMPGLAALADRVHGRFARGDRYLFSAAFLRVFES